MEDSERLDAGLTGREAATPLRDEDITSVRIDRRSFLSRAVATGSLAVGATLATGCPGGTDSDQAGTDTEPESTDSEQESTDSDAE